MTSKSPLQMALDFLSRRAYTEDGLREKLAAYGVTNEDISECLRRLKSWGYLNDPDFGSNRIATLKARLKSRAFVKNDLLKNGLTIEICEELLDIYYPEESEINIAKEALQKKFYKQSRAHTRELSSQGILFLQRAGFSEDTIHNCFPNYSAP